MAAQKRPLDRFQFSEAAPAAKEARVNPPGQHGEKLQLVDPEGKPARRGSGGILYITHVHPEKIPVGITSVLFMWENGQDPPILHNESEWGSYVKTIVGPRMYKQAIELIYTVSPRMIVVQDSRSFRSKKTPDAPPVYTGGMHEAVGGWIGDYDSRLTYSVITRRQQDVGGKPAGQIWPLRWFVVASSYKYSLCSAGWTYIPPRTLLGCKRAELLDDARLGLFSTEDGAVFSDISKTGSRVFYAFPTCDQVKIRARLLCQRWDVVVASGMHPIIPSTTCKGFVDSKRTTDRATALAIQYLCEPYINREGVPVSVKAWGERLLASGRKNILIITTLELACKIAVFVMSHNNPELAATLLSNERTQWNKILRVGRGQSEALSLAIRLENEAARLFPVEQMRFSK